MGTREVCDIKLQKWVPYQSEHRSVSKNSNQSEEILCLQKYIRKRLGGYSHSFHKMSTANMDVTDCVSSNRSMESEHICYLP